MMELVSRLAREPWTDRPACVHPVLSAVARAAHDHSTSAGRRELLPLAPHFLNTNHTGFQPSARLVALCVSTALTGGELQPDEEHRLGRAHRTALQLLDSDGGTDQWWLRFRWSEAFYRTFVAIEHAAEAVAVTARVTGGDRDVRLRALLKQCLRTQGAVRTSPAS
ncbi:hypothetical protein [Kribbella sp. NPDC048928]|uniref:hypothetical protein n=1 Tax=Kribbella sp. NPDC048928 TaxID=3364111 RepID=UPI00371B32A4